MIVNNINNYITDDIIDNYRENYNYTNSTNTVYLLKIYKNYLKLYSVFVYNNIDTFTN